MLQAIDHEITIQTLFLEPMIVQEDGIPLIIPISGDETVHQIQIDSDHVQNDTTFHRRMNDPRLYNCLIRGNEPQRELIIVNEWDKLVRQSVCLLSSNCLTLVTVLIQVGLLMQVRVFIGALIIILVMVLRVFSILELQLLFR